MTEGPRLSALPAWFGKLPSRSEFFNRRLLPDFSSEVEEWMRDGMKHLVVAESEDWRERYLVAPLWHFAMTADIWNRDAILGCIAPSADKFGRTFPLIVLQAFRGGDLIALLPPQCDWLHDLDRLTRNCVGQAMAPEEFDRCLIDLTRAVEIGSVDSTSGILKDLGISEPGSGRQRTHFPWPDLKDQFSARRRRSFWWAETAPSRPSRQIIHSGEPDSELFRLLFGEI